MFIVYQSPEQKWKLGVLNLENQDSVYRKPLIAHDYISTKAFVQEYSLTDADDKFEELLTQVYSENVPLCLFKKPI